MFENYTDRARRVLQLANQEAQRFNHEYIGTEHLLLGLVKEGSGVAANVLTNLNVDLRKTRMGVEALVKSGPEMVTMGKLPQTPRAKKVLEYANEERHGLNHNFLGTEHLLLGLLREQEGVAAQVLMNNGVKLNEAREEVLAMLGTGIRLSSGNSESGNVSSENEIPATTMKASLDLVDQQLNFPRRVPLDARTVRKILVALNTSGRNNVFLQGNRHMVNEYVSHIAGLMAEGSWPESIKTRMLFQLGDDGIAKFGEVCSEARRCGNMILFTGFHHGLGRQNGEGSDRKRRRLRSRKMGQNSDFITKNRGWLGLQSIRFIFAGSARQWLKLCKHAPQVADGFTLVSLPEADSAATKTIVELGREELESDHVVEFNDQAVALAIELTESSFGGSMSMPHMVIRVLDYAAAHKWLFMENSDSEEQAGLRSKIRELSVKQKSEINKGRFSQAVKVQEEISKIRAELLGAGQDLPKVNVDDIRLAIEDLTQ